MKKTFIAVALVAAFGLTMVSCSKKEKCWKVEATQTVSMGDESESMVTILYVWASEDEIDAKIKSSSIGMTMGADMSAKMTYKTTPAGEFKTQKDCESNAPQIKM